MNLEEIIEKWNFDKGDTNLRLNYNLNEDSVVFDIGGYNGEFSRRIHKKYKSKIYCFEPVKNFYDSILRLNIPKSEIYNIGLGKENVNVPIYLDDNASSVFCRNTINKKENIKIVDIGDFIKEKNIKNIDLMKINIEGGEYELIERLIEIDFIKNIKNIQIQFHFFVTDSEKKREKIQKKFSETHKITYNYPFIWENWEKIEESL